MGLTVSDGEGMLWGGDAKIGHGAGAGNRGISGRLTGLENAFHQNGFQPFCHFRILKCSPKIRVVVLVDIHFSDFPIQKGASPTSATSSRRKDAVFRRSTTFIAREAASPRMQTRNTIVFPYFFIITPPTNCLPLCTPHRQM